MKAVRSSLFFRAREHVAPALKPLRQGGFCICRHSNVLLLSAALVGPLMASASTAFAQQVDAQSEQSTENLPLRIRGTTGSGEQDPVFAGGLSQGDNDETPDEDALTGAIPVPTARERQEQGRARPVQPEPTVLDPLVTDSPSARSNVRAAASQQGTGAVPEDQPYDPLGIRVGTWRLFTSLSQTLGFSSNTQSAADGEAGAFSQTDGSISLQSDWSRHSARLDANGSYRHFIDSDADDLPTGNVSAGLTLDLVDGVSVDSSLQYDYSTESATSTNINSSAINRPGVHAGTAAIEMARSGGKLGFSMRGSVGRTVYEDIELSGGGSESQDDRNNNLYALSGRIGYQTSPAFAPFVEGEVGRRIYDERRDRNGQKRDSTILGAGVGTQIDLGEKLTGEVSVGYRVEQFDDAALDDLGAVTLNGSLVWSPVRETTLTLNAQTDFSGSTTAGQNGSVISSLGLVAERQVSDRLTLTADAGVTYSREDDGSREDLTASVGAGFNYWLNRFMGLTARVEHTQQFSTDSAQEYDETNAQIGIRLQR